MQIDSNQKFVLPNYDTCQPFSNFLPGIAGKSGTPMWVFYVNRGQAVTSFGVQSKDQALLEFQPANKAYMMTDYFGFRTFLKLETPVFKGIYQPFFPNANSDFVKRTMTVEMNGLTIQETHSEIGLRTRVAYFTLPDEPFAALVRMVSFENISDQTMVMECLDGLPALIPFGASDTALKKVGRTIEAWMQVENLDHNLPFFRMRAGTEDTADVTAIQAGHFAYAFSDQEEGQLLPVFVDPYVVFQQNTSFFQAIGFQNESINDLQTKHQNIGGQTPCVMFSKQMRLATGEQQTLYEIYGHLADKALIQNAAERFSSVQALLEKQNRAQDLVTEITDPIKTCTDNPLFDQYCRQTFLDNLIRGGMPVSFEGGKQIVHIYGRKHGDPERDYNDFSLAPEPYSQGNANYRDVNQNRRSDILFYPQVGSFNIHTFMDLVQLDGYNPLVVKGSLFTLSEQSLAQLKEQYALPATLITLLNKPFTPGSLFQTLFTLSPEGTVAAELFETILGRAEQNLLADHGEGFWTDHWTYNLDQIEAYLAIFPDREQALLFEDRTYRFYENDHFVQPRSQRYVLLDGQPIQLNAVAENEILSKKQENNLPFSNWVKTQFGEGELYTTDLFTKLFLLGLIKMATLDPYGMGIEMEGGKPGWYDALNGLPGLFGSSMAETYELHRLFSFLDGVVKIHAEQKIRIPIEANTLLIAVEQAVSENLKNPQNGDFVFWERINQAREQFREKTMFGLSGEEKIYALGVLQPILPVFQQKVWQGIQRAIQLQGGTIPTYFYYQALEYDVHEDQTDHLGRPAITIKRFGVNNMPLFLEGFVRYLKIEPNSRKALQIHQQVMNSALFDQNLGLYKVNAPLKDLPYTIGRARAFTPGWLENESVWLHMAYKYILTLLEAGLSESFLAEVKRAFVPFWNASQYGRSTTENSSFIVSSAHPESRLHGAGFVARLSGSTAEFLSIWFTMMVGKNPFREQNGSLSFSLLPTLPAWLFNHQGLLKFTFMGNCVVILHNESGLDLMPEKTAPRHWLCTYQDGHQETVTGSVLAENTAEALRSGKIMQLDVHF